MAATKTIRISSLLMIASLAFGVTLTSAAQDRTELQNHTEQSQTPAPKSFQTVPPPASAARVLQPANRHVPTYECQGDSNQPFVAVPLSQSPSLVQEDPDLRVQTTPGVEQHSGELVQAIPRIGEN